MKCAYSAGILDRFIDEGITFDYAVGVSAGSANAISFLAGQRGRALRFYTDHIHEPGYFGFKSWLTTGDLFGLQYIYGTLSNEGGADALDFQAILANPCVFEAVATDAATGEPHYFTKADMGPRDFRAIMASSAIPAACRPVEIGGRRYFDGGISDSIPVERALAQGCDKLVVVLSKTRDYYKRPEGHKALYHLLCHKYPKAVEDLDRRHLMYRACQARTYELESQGTAVVFASTEPIDIGTYTMDVDKNQALYDRALADFDQRQGELMEFLRA